MKQVIKYEDNSGKVWDTEQQAILADNKLIMDDIIEKSTFSGDFDFSEFIVNVKESSIAITALLNLLSVDLVSLQADILMKKDKG